MKISVIIPCFNEEKYITKCLEALESQSVKPDEILIIDNNCTDRTIELAKKFKTRIVKEKIQGMISARNRGFDEAEGEVIARTDADTIVSRDWIKTIKKDFKDEGLAALSGPALFDYRLARKFPKVNLIFTHTSSKFLIGHNTLFGPNMAIRKSVWEKVRNDICLDDKTVHEDLDLAIHIGGYGAIQFDWSMAAVTSTRRIEKDLSGFLTEYPARWIKTLYKHNLPL